MNRPDKPYPGFPLSPNLNGQWFKKIKQKPYYFGKWSDDPKGLRALAEYNRRLPDIDAGRDHLRANGAVTGAVTLGDLLGRFLAQCRIDVKAGSMSKPQFGDYLRECSAFVEWAKDTTPIASLRAEDFTAYHNGQLIEGRKLRAKARKRVLANVKRMFRWGPGNVSGCTLPPFGDGFKAPSTTDDALRMEKARLGLKDNSKRILSGTEINRLLEIAQPNFRAMILLAVNCGLGPADLGRLRWSHLGDGETLDYPRGKTGAERRGYLWKMTRDALLRVRETKHGKAAYEKAGQNALVFVTRKREAYYREEEVVEEGKVVDVKVHNAISITFGRLVKKCPGLEGVTFYRLRHTFKTLGKKAKDADALNLMMGHKERTTGKGYDHEEISPKRIRRVALKVKARLWPKPKESAGTQPLRLAS